MDRIGTCCHEVCVDEWIDHMFDESVPSIVLNQESELAKLGTTSENHNWIHTGISFPV